MAEEQLTTLHVRSEQQSGCLCCFYKIRRRFLKRHVQGLLTYSMFAYRVTSCLVQ